MNSSNASCCSSRKTLTGISVVDECFRLSPCKRALANAKYSIDRPWLYFTTGSGGTDLSPKDMLLAHAISKRRLEYSRNLSRRHGDISPKTADLTVDPSSGSMAVLADEETC